MSINNQNNENPTNTGPQRQGTKERGFYENGFIGKTFQHGRSFGRDLSNLQGEQMQTFDHTKLIPKVQRVKS